jgi:LPS-assembly lipoprotein
MMKQSIGMIARLGAILSTCLVVAACGFVPLYGQGGVNQGLSAIEVHVPQGRSAYLVRESLDDSLGRDLRQPALYRLDITVDERRFARGLRIDNVANRYELQLKVGYKLINKATGTVVLTGSAPVAVTYDSADAPYGGITAQQDGQKRAASQAAQQIQLEISRYLAKLPKP